MRKLALLIILVTALVAGMSAACAADLKYWIGVNKDAHQVTVYSTEDNSIVHRWTCTTGKNTPHGVFYLKSPKTKVERTEGFLPASGSYYCWVTRIDGSILFHSYLYDEPNAQSIIVDTLDELGETASHGCVRLSIDGASWIALNCPIGTKTVIYTNAEDPLILNALGDAPETGEELGLENAPTAVSITPVDTKVINVGETLQLGTELTPADAQTHITWATSSKSIATVSTNGLVTGKKSGIVTITAVTSNGLYSRFTLDVNDPAVPRRLTLDTESTVTMDVGDTLQVTASVIPETAPVKLTWKSGSSKVADVSRTGLITAKSKGTARITVTTQNNIRATVTVNVIDTKTPTAVKLNYSGQITVNLDEPLQLTAAVEPETAVTTLTWKSGLTRVATVDQNGLVTPIKKGRATVTVKTKNGKSASVTLIVVDPHEAEAVQLDHSGTVLLNLGETLQLQATLYPETAESPLTWTSGNRRIAAVSSEGLVNPLKTGTAKITVKTRNNKSASVTVKVVDPHEVDSVKLDHSGKVLLNLGETLQLQATLYPETAESSLTWTSGNHRVADVSAEGVVTPLKTGTARITVKTRNNKSAWVTVIVVDPTIATGVTLNYTGIVDVPLGSTLQLTAMAVPDTAITAFRWSTSNRRIATVDAEGLVTPLKLGKTVITVRTANGKRARVTIRVVEPSRVAEEEAATPTDLEEPATQTDLKE